MLTPQEAVEVAEVVVYRSAPTVVPPTEPPEEVLLEAQVAQVLEREEFRQTGTEVVVEEEVAPREHTRPGSVLTEAAEEVEERMEETELVSVASRYLAAVAEVVPERQTSVPQEVLR